MKYNSAELCTRHTRAVRPRVADGGGTRAQSARPDRQRLVQRQFAINRHGAKIMARAPGYRAVATISADHGSPTLIRLAPFVPKALYLSFSTRLGWASRLLRLFTGFIQRRLKSPLCSERLGPATRSPRSKTAKIPEKSPQIGRQNCKPLRHCGINTDFIDPVGVNVLFRACHLRRWYWIIGCCEMFNAGKADSTCLLRFDR